MHQVLSGIANGGIYASVALALVMIYQATHHLNFAQGEMATFSTYIALTLINFGLPYWVAFVITVAMSFVIGAIIERILMRPMMDAPVLSSVGVFIGLLLIINACSGWFFDYTIKQFPTPFPSQPMLGGYISGHELGSTAVTLIVLLAVYLFFRHTKLGLGMRAAAFNPASARLVGIRVGFDAVAGLGPCGGDRRHRGHDGRADRLPRSQHDGRHLAVRLRRRAAGRHRQSARRGAGRLRGRHHRESRRRLPGRHRAEAEPGAGDHRRRAGGETDRPAGPGRAEQGVGRCRRTQAMAGGAAVRTGVKQPMPGDVSFDASANPVVPADTGQNTYTTAGYGSLPPEVMDAAQRAARQHLRSGSGWLIVLAVLRCRGRAHSAVQRLSPVPAHHGGGLCDRHSRACRC